MTVHIDRQVLANFRRRAWKRFPKEHLEALFGRREGDVVYITLFYPFPHDATIWACEYDREEIERLRVEAEHLNLDYLGSVHTHTGLKTCEHASEMDHIGGVEEGSSVEAILYLHRSGRSTSKLTFYIPSEPIKVQYC